MFKQLLNSDPAFRSVLVAIGNFTIVFIAVYCTFNALFSSFVFALNMGILIGIWVIGAGSVSIITLFYGSKGLAFLLIPAVLLFFWIRTEIIEGGGYVINFITDYYSEWLSITVLFPDYNEFSDSTTMFFAALSTGVIFLLGYSVCVRRSIFLTALSTAPIVFLTFVITDLQADFIYILGLTAVYLTLLISSAINPDDFHKRGLMLIPAFALAFILMALSYRITLPENYSREEQLDTMNNRLRYVTVHLSRLGRMFQSGFGGYYSEFGWLVSQDGEVWLFNTDNVNVADAGSRAMSNRGLLEINVDRPGTFYIRGFSMQNFDGRMWSISDELLRQQNEELERAMPALIARAFGETGLPDAPVRTEMSITRTGDLTPRINYHPYYRTQYGGFHIQLSTERFYHVERSIHRLAESLNSIVIFISNLTNNELLVLMDEFPVFIPANRGGGVFEFTPTALIEMFSNMDNINISPYDGITNAHQVMIYGTDEGGMPTSPFEALMDEVQSAFPDKDLEYTINHQAPSLISYRSMMRYPTAYSGISPGVANELRRIATEAGININADRIELVDEIAAFIRSSAEYTLTPGVVPDDEDFVLYFLQELREGYCIHFATAAVMMLRAFNIPARFTSGYVTTVSGSSVGNTVVLTDRNAHAWAEVYYDDVGWLYLEVTPTSSLSFVPPARPHSPHEETPGSQTPPQLRPDDIPEYPQEPEIDESGNTPTPGTGAGTGSRTSDVPPWLTDAFLIFILIVSIIPILLIRRYVVLIFRKAGFNKKDTNEAVIYTWRYVMRLSKKETIPPDDIEELALKARFSQHRMTEEERSVMVKYAERLAFEVYSSKGDVGQLKMKYLRALC